MSGTSINNKDHKDVSSALLSLSGAATPSIDNDAPTSNVPASNGDKTSKETTPKQQLKPESLPKTAPEVVNTEKKEETTTLAEKDDKESLSERAARHLEQANTVMIAEESIASPEAASSTVPDPPKGWGREFESILDSSPSGATAKSEEKDPSADKPAPNNSNQDDKTASKTNGSETETKKEAVPGEKRRVCSKSVGSATSTSSVGRRKKVSAKSTLKGATLSGMWTATEANEKKRKASETKKPAAVAKKKRPTKASAPPAAAAAPRLAPTEVYSGPPDATDKLKDGEPWPAGWTKKKFQRRSGSTKGRPDPYWYSPIENKKLRSMNEVNRFMDALKKTKGDELKAWEIFKKK